MASRVSRKPAVRNGAKNGAKNGVKNGVARAHSPRSPLAGSQRGTRIQSTVTREIGSRILWGEYPPGDVLPNEAEWSRIFRISRSAVRESIKVLMGKGMLSSRPRIGTTVEPRERWSLLDRDVLAWYAAMPSKMQFLRSVQEMRSIIEPEAAALAALRRTPEQTTHISAACAAMGTAGTIAHRIDADVRFHLGILAAAGNEFLIPFGFVIESALAAVFDYTTRDRKDLAHSDKLHEHIAEAIRRGQPQRARLAAQRLIANTDAFIVRKSQRVAKSGPRRRPARRAADTRRP